MPQTVRSGDLRAAVMDDVRNICALQQTQRLPCALFSCLTQSDSTVDGAALETTEKYRERVVSIL